MVIYFTESFRYIFTQTVWSPLRWSSVCCALRPSACMLHHLQKVTAHLPCDKEHTPTAGPNTHRRTHRVRNGFSLLKSYKIVSSLLRKNPKNVLRWEQVSGYTHCHVWRFGKPPSVFTFGFEAPPPS